MGQSSTTRAALKARKSKGDLCSRSAVFSSVSGTRAAGLSAYVCDLRGAVYGSSQRRSHFYYQKTNEGQAAGRKNTKLSLVANPTHDPRAREASGLDLTLRK